MSDTHKYGMGNYRCVDCGRLSYLYVVCDACLLKGSITPQRLHPPKLPVTDKIAALRQFLSAKFERYIAPTRGDMVKPPDWSKLKKKRRPFA